LPSNPAYVLSSLDLTIVGAYLAAVVLVGLLVARRRATTEEFFLASRASPWPVIGLSLVASNISSATLIGLPGAAYATGISVYNYEWSAAVVIVFSCVFVMPVILRAQVFTMPEFLERRYAPFVRTYFSALTIFLNVVLDTAGTLFAGSLMFRMLMPDVPLWQIAALLALATGVYGIAGGLRSLLATEVIQALILLVGGALITVFAFEQAGGWTEVMTRVPAEKLSLIRPHDDPGVPWTGLLTGIPLIGFYFWCSNQFMMQQVLSAKSLDQARWGSLFAGLLKLPVLFFMILPGSAALLIFPDLQRPDEVYPKLLFELLPPGLIGVVVAGFLAAMMSTLASTYNAASTLVTMDFVARYRPQTSSGALVMTGRLATFAFMIVSIAWVPVVERMGGTLWHYLQSVLSYATPPAVALFMAALFWPRANALGAGVGIVVGLISSVALFWAVQVEGTLEIHFLVVAAIIFGLSFAGVALGSLAAPAPAREQVEPMMFTARYWREETAALAPRPWYANYRILAAILMLFTAVIVLRFH
jgi:SSS family solute:Na+ symporter